MVNKYNNKLSADCNDRYDYSIVKKVTDYIGSPLTYLCNLSFRTGIFPYQLKISKV